MTEHQNINMKASWLRSIHLFRSLLLSLLSLFPSSLIPSVNVSFCSPLCLSLLSTLPSQRFSVSLFFSIISLRSSSPWNLSLSLSLSSLYKNIYFLYVNFLISRSLRLALSLNLSLLSSLCLGSLSLTLSISLCIVSLPFKCTTTLSSGILMRHLFVPDPHSETPARIDNVLPVTPIPSIHWTGHVFVAHRESRQLCNETFSISEKGREQDTHLHTRPSFMRGIRAEIA